MSLANWGALLAAAARMGVPPDAFWRMSLSEWRLMAEGGGGLRPMASGELETLAKTYPDTGEANGGRS